jgi:hypothetical protein
LLAAAPLQSDRVTNLLSHLSAKMKVDFDKYHGNDRATLYFINILVQSYKKSYKLEKITDFTKLLPLHEFDIYRVDPEIILRRLIDDAQEIAGLGFPKALRLPLWHTFENKWSPQWQRTRSAWLATDDPGWQFWVEWYDAALDGRPLLDDWDRHWALLNEISLIDPETWDKGPDAVNPAVAKIFEKHDIKRQAEELDAEYDRIRKEVFATKPAPRDHNNPPEILELDPRDFDTVCEAATTAHDAVSKIGKEAGKQSPDPHVLERESNRLWNARQLALRYLGGKANLAIDTLIKWGVPGGVTWLLSKQLEIEQLVASVRSLIGAL